MPVCICASIYEFRRVRKEVVPFLGHQHHIADASINLNAALTLDCILRCCICKVNVHIDKSDNFRSRK